MICFASKLIDEDLRYADLSWSLLCHHALRNGVKQEQAEKKSRPADHIDNQLSLKQTKTKTSTGEISNRKKKLIKPSNQNLISLHCLPRVKAQPQNYLYRPGTFPYLPLPTTLPTNTAFRQGASRSNHPSAHDGARPGDHNAKPMTYHGRQSAVLAPTVVAFGRQIW